MNINFINIKKLKSIKIIIYLIFNSHITIYKKRCHFYMKKK